MSSKNTSKNLRNWALKVWFMKIEKWPVHLWVQKAWLGIHNDQSGNEKLFLQYLDPLLESDDTLIEDQFFRSTLPIVIHPLNHQSWEWGACFL